MKQRRRLHSRFAEASTQIETVATLMEEEVVTLPIQSEKAKTSGDKVGMQIPQEIVSDSDDEKDTYLSLLKLEVNKWKDHADQFQEGMVPLF